MAAIPDDLRYSPDHLWVRVDGDRGVIRAGVTNFAQRSLGDVVEGVPDLVAGLAEPFLDLAGRLVDRAFAMEPLIVGQIAPRLLGFPLDLVLLAVELVVVHGRAARAR